MPMFSSIAFSFNIGNLNLPFAGVSPLILALRIARGFLFDSSAALASPLLDWAGGIAALVIS